MKKRFLILIPILMFSILAINSYTGFSNQNVLLLKIDEKSKLKANGLSTQWAANGTPVCVQTPQDQYNPEICSDGTGGAIITWADSRDISSIYVQRIDSNGNPLWDVNGTLICNSPGSQTLPQICSDGSGGAIIAWEDTQNIKAQRVDANGITQWTANGVQITGLPNDESRIEICSDNLGGAILTWINDEFATSNIHAQRINSSGVVQWTTNGKIICNAINIQTFPKISVYGAGNAIITWQDYRNMTTSDNDIYCQFINSTGHSQLQDNGTVICNATDSQYWPDICCDSSGNAIITWVDNRNGTYTDIYAQKIDSTGTVYWTLNGTPICTAEYSQFYPKICCDSEGNAIITWQDLRNIYEEDIYTQKINPIGTTLWRNNGTPVCTSPSDQQQSRICCDSSGNSFISWIDKEEDANGSIYAQMLDKNGILQYVGKGLPVCTEYGLQENHEIIYVSSGVAIITWQDNRSLSDYDIYAQKVSLVSTEPMDNFIPIPTGAGFPIDPLILLIIIGAMAIVILVLVAIIIKK